MIHQLFVVMKASNRLNKNTLFVNTIVIYLINVNLLIKFLDRILSSAEKLVIRDRIQMLAAMLLWLATTSISPYTLMGLLNLNFVRSSILTYSRILTQTMFYQVSVRRVPTFNYCPRYVFMCSWNVSKRRAKKLSFGYSQRCYCYPVVVHLLVT